MLQTWPRLWAALVYLTRKLGSQFAGVPDVLPVPEATVAYEENNHIGGMTALLGANREGMLRQTVNVGFDPELSNAEKVLRFVLVLAGSKNAVSRTGFSMLSHLNRKLVMECRRHLKDYVGSQGIRTLTPAALGAATRATLGIAQTTGSSSGLPPAAAVAPAGRATDARLLSVLQTAYAPFAQLTRRVARAAVVGLQEASVRGGGPLERMWTFWEEALSVLPNMSLQRRARDSAPAATLGVVVLGNGALLPSALHNHDWLVAAGRAARQHVCRTLHQNAAQAAETPALPQNASCSLQTKASRSGSSAANVKALPAPLPTRKRCATCACGAPGTRATR